MARGAAIAEKRGYAALQRAIFAEARRAGLIDERPAGALDSTGFEARHVSAHFRSRAGRGKHRRYHTWPKLTILVHTSSHLVAAAIPSRGPGVDHLEFVPALAEALEHLPLDRLLADAGYDAEHAHVWAREFFGIPHTVVALNRRMHPPLPPKTPYRCLMHFDFPKHLYGQRWQAESVISRNKRRLGSALRSRSDSRQANELRLRFLTHNLMILKRPRPEGFNGATPMPQTGATSPLADAG